MFRHFRRVLYGGVTRIAIDELRGDRLVRTDVRVDFGLAILEVALATEFASLLRVNVDDFHAFARKGGVVNLVARECMRML